MCKNFNLVLIKAIISLLVISCYKDTLTLLDVLSHYIFSKSKNKLLNK